MQKSALIAIAAGLLSAILHLAIQGGFFAALLLALLSPLPLFLAGLWLGLSGILIAAGAGTVVVAASTGLDQALVYAAADAAPAALIVRLALLNRTTEDSGTEWYPPGFILSWLTLYAVGAFVVIAAALGDGLQTAIAEYVDGFRAVFSGSEENLAMDQLLASIKQMFPFLVVTWWIVIMSMNAVLGQRILVRMGRNLRPAPDFTSTTLARWLGPAVVAAAAIALVGSGWLGFVATNVALILCVPYFLAGLAVLHAISARWRGRTAILFALYLFLLLFGWPVLLVTGVGVVEHWAGLRERFADADRSSNERNE